MSQWMAVVDGIGVYGNFLHYGIVIALVGSAFLVFLYLWRKKRLDMDEEPKFQMMREDIDAKEGDKEGDEICLMKEKIK